MHTTLRPPITMLALIFLVAAVSKAGEPLRLHCRWLNPADRKMQEITFTGNPLLAVLPGESLEIAIPDSGTTGRIAIIKDGKPFREDASLTFTAPETPGSYFIPLSLAANGEKRDAEICVLVPHKASAAKTADKSLILRADGQEIGQYRHPSRSSNIKVRANPGDYQPPVWWMRITNLNAAFEIVPGLTLGELVVASEDTGTKHTDLVPVCYPMWKAIVTIRQALPSRNIPGEALKLISMFRAPAYNRSIGSNAFGRHIYGDAFDFYIDLTDSGKAADLNHDGKLDRHDIYPVVAMVEDLQADGKIPLGGIGVYNTVAGDHVVTMHLDMRGHRATWGFFYGASGKKSDFLWASRRFAENDRRDELDRAERAAKEGRRYYQPRRDPLP